MSEMVARVARAITDKLAEGTGERFHVIGPIEGERAARAAIAELRVLTEEMIEAFWNDADRMPSTFWSAMIDAALK